MAAQATISNRPIRQRSSLLTPVHPALLPGARDLLTAFSYIEIDEEVADGAMNEPDRSLRSLDAIHLASARLLGPDLDALVTHDSRLASAATDAGLAVLAPAG